MRSGMLADQDKQADGRDHENDGRPGGELGEQVGRTAWTESGLRTLTAKGTGEISALTLLQEHDADQKQADDDMDHGDEVGKDHEIGSFLRPNGLALKLRVERAEILASGAEGGT